MAEEKKENTTETTEKKENVAETTKKKVVKNDLYKCMRDCYLEGVFYRRGRDYTLSNTFCEKYEGMFKKSATIKNVEKEYDPTGESIKDAQLKKYSASLYGTPQAAPPLAINEGGLA